MNKIKFLLTLSIFFFSLLISTKAFSKDCGKLTIADMNWGSATLMAHVDKVILQKGYDCDVDMVVGDTVPVFTGMKGINCYHPFEQGRKRRQTYNHKQNTYQWIGRGMVCYTRYTGKTPRT